jgi:hypothetical protein
MSETCCLASKPAAQPPATSIALFTPPVPVPAHIAARAAARRKLWEVPHHHHCVLLGAAFDARELRHVYRRTGYADWEGASDYQLHSSAVQHARARNGVSRTLHKTLEERFAGAVAHLRAARDRREVIVYWRHWAATDDPVGAYWAAITHPSCDPDADELLSQEMHMLSHFAFAERRAAGRRLRAADERAAVLEAARDRALKQCEALRRGNAELRAETTHWKQAAKVAREALDRGADGAPLRARDARIGALESALAAAQRAARAAQRETASLREARDRARSVAPAPSAPQPAESDSADALPRVDLARRTVLCVGGKTRLVPHDRAIVEASSGAFAHHDGGVEDHPARLPPLLGAADAVVCLATDVSHGAYHAVKRYCKRFGKPCVLVGNSSVSALARSLVTVAAAPATR